MEAIQKMTEAYNGKVTQVSDQEDFCEIII